MYKILIKNDVGAIYTYITNSYKREDKFIEFVDKIGKLRVFPIERLYEVKEIDE